MRVVATAGHVDHGKSSLVLALTGTDPDRFPEEKERGLTIDLGFAFGELPSGQVVGFVDVPGHVRFVKNMLAGVGAVDVALLVVAANGGWMPQTAEHVAILELLDVAHGMVTLTKADLVSADELDLARLDIAEHLEDTVLADWPVVAVDSVSGSGIHDVRTSLDAVLAAAPTPRDDARPRLWVDRAFSARGAGTIVTGTLVGGALALDDEVLVEPGGKRARVRRIESRHEQLDRAEPGSRVALNLSGVDHGAVQRGDAIVLPGQWAVVTTFDVAVRAVRGQDLPRGSVQMHVGSGEHAGRIRVLDEHASLARITVGSPVPLAPGDRLVLRSSGARATIGGATVLDVAPATRAADAITRLAMPLGARLMRARPWAVAAELPALAGVTTIADELVERGDAIAVGGWLVAPGELQRVREEAFAHVHERSPDALGVDLAATAAHCGVDPSRLRAALAQDGRLRVERDLVRDATATAVVDDPAAMALVAALNARPFDPPAPRELGAAPALIRALVGAGALVDVDGIVFSAAALDDARRRVARAVLRDGALTVSAARTLLGSTRKFVVPILNRLDADGITRRRGDDRIAGPRATDWT
ncbi:MAG: selenocysteine-specific translation elongation factor [Actinomycetota bacterium]